MPSPALLFNTVRHLRPGQIASRVYFHVADRLGNPESWQRRLQAVEIGDCHWDPRTDFLPPEQQGNSAQQIAVGRFCFQNDERHVDRPIDWDPSDSPLLWRYNLHYFDYIWSLEFSIARDIADDWINRHTIGRGQVGWEPYPISLRLMNWCSFFFGRHKEQTCADAQFMRAIQRSINTQAAWLSRRLEYHLLGNHLLENAAALAFVGSCFGGPEAVLYGRIGTQLLRTQLEEQILADGMHFELSPMYHSRVLFLVLSLMNIVPEEAREWLGGYATKMLDALAFTSHPDGRIALLNDSAFGVYPGLSALAEYSGRLGVQNERSGLLENKTFALEDAGYFGACTKEGHYVICDAGCVGPDYIPGHAHGDIFSFELSLFGDRLIVDSGVYDYERSEMRRYCRSTAAHNTVQIANQDQCEFWDAFKVARRGRPHGVRFQPTSQGFRLSGWHDGYRSLPGKPTHYREFEWRHDGRLIIRDRVESSSRVPFVTRIHLHPECHISEHQGSSFVLERGGRRYELTTDGSRLQIGQSWYSPRFGVKQRRPVVDLVPTAPGMPIVLSLISVNPSRRSDVD